MARKKTLNALKNYEKDNGAFAKLNRIKLQKAVLDSVSTDKIKKYEKLRNNKSTEENRLEEMHWDTRTSEKGTKQAKKVEKATKEYNSLVDELSKDLIGKYANKKLGKTTSWGKTVVKKGKDYVTDVLDDIADYELYRDNSEAYQETFNRSSSQAANQWHTETAIRNAQFTLHAGRHHV